MESKFGFRDVWGVSGYERERSGFSNFWVWFSGYESMGWRVEREQDLGWLCGLQKKSGLKKKIWVNLG